MKNNVFDIQLRILLVRRIPKSAYLMQRYASNTFDEKSMNRRTLIKHSLLLGTATLVTLNKTIAAMAQRPVKESKNYHHFKLGKLDLFVVTDGHILFPSVQPSFAPGVDSSSVNHLLKDNFLSTVHADLSMNVMVIRSGRKVILIDTGCGTLFGENCGWLNESLSKINIHPKQVTDIILTHAHPDHIGGLLTAHGDLIYTNANIYLSRIEHAFWSKPQPDLSKCKMNNETTKKLIIDTAQKTLVKAKKKIHLFDNGDTLLDCLKLKLAPGHTPGHSIINIFSDGKELVHTGDLVHSPVLVFTHPEWGFDGDTNFEEATQTRKAVLEQLTQSRQQVFSYHLPWPGLGHVREKGDGYEWIPNSFALPG
jgi:glyoxylase-like metal-dependent hydrolase (beta-lactamase superfamily II)